MNKKSIQKKTGGRSRKKQPAGKNRARIARTGEQSARAEYLFDNIHEALVILDLEGRIQSMNQAARDLLGEPGDSLTLEDWPRVFGLYASDGGSELSLDELPPRRALQGERVEAEEMILRRAANPKGIWICMSARPLTGVDGRVEGAVALLEDINEHKRTALSRERYGLRIETFYRLTRILAASGEDARQIARQVALLTSEVLGDLSVVTLLNANGEKLNIAGYHDADPVAMSAFGELLAATDTFSRDQGLVVDVIRSGKPLLIPSVSVDQLLANAAPMFAGFIREFGVDSLLLVPMIGRSSVIGTINLSRHRSGRSYNVADQTFLMEIAHRTALAIENCTLVDSLRLEISERLSTKEALEASEDRFRSIFESTNLGIKVLDSIGTILQTNPSYQRMMGYGEAELVGRNFFDFIHPGDLERALKFFNDLKISGAHEFHFEHRTLGRDGSTIWVRTTFAAVRRRGGDDSLAFVVGILENISRQKQMDKERLELKNRLQSNVELERLRLARELHDGPMQELYSAIYKLKEFRMKANPEMAEALENVSNDIQKVLYNLRITAKELRPPTISSFGLEKSIRSYAEDFRETYPHIQLHLSLAQDRQLLPEDLRLTLFRILQQSLTNVAQHANATEVHIRFSFDAEEARLEVMDNGRGFKVPANWLTLVRDGHYGLAGSAERVDALGGTFVVASQPNQPTVVRVVIPWNEIPASPEAEQEPIVRRAKDLI
jgi:PAS domain S-box-containing protein